MDERLATQLELSGLPDAEFVERAYALLLGRRPDADALATALASLDEKSLSRTAFIAELAESTEFLRARAIDDALTRAAAARSTGERPRALRAPAGVDERPIELAWTLGRYRKAQRVLDVGYAFAEPAWIVALTQLGAPELVGVDLAERDVPGMRSVVADVRSLPFDDRTFDVVFCISTLEHVGHDNTRYGSASEADTGGPLTALRELRRVTRPRGRIYVTVPCARQPADWYWRQPAAAWRARFRDADLYAFEEELYVDRADGWSPGEANDDGVLCAELHPGRRRHEFLRLLRRR